MVIRLRFRFRYLNCNNTEKDVESQDDYRSGMYFKFFKTFEKPWTHMLSGLSNNDVLFGRYIFEDYFINKKLKKRAIFNEVEVILSVEVRFFFSNDRKLDVV